MYPTPLWTDHWNSIVAKFIARPRLLIACDFDGTLSPIVDDPADAVLPNEARGILRKLRAMPGVTVAVISGRAVCDLRARVGIDGVLYAGNHGLEIDSPGILWTSAEAREHRPELALALVELRREIGAVPGVIIEDKQLTGTVHWRQVDPDLRPELHLKVEEIVSRQPGLRLMEGKAIWEVRPRTEWNKGSALQTFLGRLHLSSADAVYLGDDDTDEAGFEALPDGLSLRVGDTDETAARYRLPDQQAAIAFLFCLLSARIAGRRNPLAAYERSRSSNHERDSKLS